MNRAAERTIRLAVALFVIIIAPRYVQAAAGCDGAGNCYIYASATGSGTGANWTNAYTGFGSGAGKINPGSMTRGVTYWIGAGSYGAVNFSSASSGTTVITLESATAANHGPAGDWNNSIQGQALFIGESSVNSDYWTFNGQQRGADWRSGYLMKFWNQTNMASGCAFHGNSNHIRWDYVEIQGTTNIQDSGATTGDNAFCSNSGKIIDWYQGHGYYHETGNTQMQLNNGNSPGPYMFEYNYVYKNHTAHNANHDEAFSLTISNTTIRYSVFQDICSSGIITDAAGGTPTLSNWDIYGNLFFWDPAYAALNGSGQWATLDDGVVGLFGENWSGYLRFTNNTIAGIYNSHMDAPGAGAGSGIGPNVPAGTVMNNNLWWGSGYVFGVKGDYNAAWAGPAINSQFDGGIGSEPHGYVNNSSTTNPFVNWTSSTLAGFQLTTSGENTIPAGLTMSSPYDVDLFGVTRGSNGKWDRGAFQIGSASSSQPPNPPTGLTVTSIK
jgi:hypothetical protein